MGLYSRAGTGNKLLMPKMATEETNERIGERNDNDDGYELSNRSALSTLEISSPSKNSHNIDDGINLWFLIRGTVLASLGGIMFGYDIGVVSGALPHMKNTFDLSSMKQEMIVSFMYLGAVFGAAVGGYVCDRKGRRFGILFTDIIFLVGALLLSTATDLVLVLIGRVVVGFAVSISSIAAVAYLHEIAPRKYRGAMVSCNEASVSIGFLIASLLSFLMGDMGEESWRTLFGLSGAIALFQMFGMLFMPESPVWLESKGRVSEAAVIRNISGLNATTEEIHDSTSSIHSSSDLQSERPLSSLKYFLTQHYRQATVAMFLATAQQFCGHINVLSFAPEIFSQAGLGDEAAFLSTLFLGLLKFAVTVIVICLIDRVGRRTLLLSGISTIIVSLLILIIAFRDNELGGNAANVAIFGAMGVVAGYAASFGPLTWLLTSEIFPTHVRGRALGATTCMSYLCASLVAYTFLSLQDFFESRWGPFLIYLAVSLGSFAFAYLAIPDTADKSVKDIEIEMERMWWWKTDEIQRFPSVVEVSPNDDRVVSLD